MCGIVGAAGCGDGALIQRMNDVIVHRGPDDGGEYRSADGMVTLAMRRLSIIDLESGRQPMSNQDRTVWIVFNGEIYNAPELRADLEKKGRRFVTSHSDTEVLLQLYEEKGPSLLEDLNGMFAFAIHDSTRRLIFGARDRMGIKPLYYWSSNGKFAFASELKSLLTLPSIEREIDLQSLFHYMTLLCIPGDESILKGVYRVPPGHSFTYDLKQRRLTLDEYWRPKFDGLEQRSEREWTELLREELRAAVRRWSLSDVPIACSLSGGIDSSAVVGLLAEQGFSKIKTFSVGFRGEDEQAWNELELARLVAEKWETEHHEIVLEPEELLSDLVQMVWHLDEPYGGGLPSWYVFREMARDVKVGLTGTGGDELFGNYGKFRIYEQGLPRTLTTLRRWSPAAAGIAAGLASPAAGLANRLPASWRWVGRGRILSDLPLMIRCPFGYYHHANADYFSDKQKRNAVLAVKNGDLHDTAVYLQRLYDGAQTNDLRNGLAAVAFRTQLAEEFLFMTDRFSMAHSLEARVPYLDHTLVETVFRIPPRVRTRPDDLKYLFKLAVADLLPPPLLTARKKGFVIPVELWLRRTLRPLVEQLLHPERLRRQGLFDSGFYERFALPHLEGRADFTWQVWAALMFQLWHVVFIEQKQTEKPAYSWEAIC